MLGKLLPKYLFGGPKEGDSPNQSYDMGMRLRPSILL